MFLLRYGVVKEIDGAGRVWAVHRYGDVVGSSAIEEVSSIGIEASSQSAMPCLPADES